MSLLNSDKYMNHYGSFRVEQLDIPGMTVHINRGTIIHNNVVVNIDEQESDVLTTPSVGTWLVVLSVDQRGNIVYSYGVQSTSSATMPKLPNDCLHLAVVELTAATTMITRDEIHDVRQMFTFSDDGGQDCQCRCTAPSTLSDADQKQLKEFYDKYEEVKLSLDQLKLALQPKSSFTMLSDSGLKYEVRLKDDGTLYTTRVGFDIPVPVDPQTGVSNYKFSMSDAVMNVVADQDGYVPFTVKIRSLDAANDPCDCTLIVSCMGTRIYGENFTPQYRDNEFRIDDLTLTKAGFVERFSINFVEHGKYTLALNLYNNKTSTLIDSASAELHVTLVDENEGNE